MDAGSANESAWKKRVGATLDRDAIGHGSRPPRARPADPRGLRGCGCGDAAEPARRSRRGRPTGLPHRGAALRRAVLEPRPGLGRAGARGHLSRPGRHRCPGQRGGAGAGHGRARRGAVGDGFGGVRERRLRHRRRPDGAWGTEFRLHHPARLQPRHRRRIHGRRIRPRHLDRRRRGRRAPHHRQHPRSQRDPRDRHRRDQRAAGGPELHPRQHGDRQRHPRDGDQRLRLRGRGQPRRGQRHGDVGHLRHPRLRPGRRPGRGRPQHHPLQRRHRPARDHRPGRQRHPDRPMVRRQHRRLQRRRGQRRRGHQPVRRGRQPRDQQHRQRQHARCRQAPRLPRRDRAGLRLHQEDRPHLGQPRAEQPGPRHAARRRGDRRRGDDHRQRQRDRPELPRQHGRRPALPLRRGEHRRRRDALAERPGARPRGGIPNFVDPSRPMAGGLALSAAPARAGISLGATRDIAGHAYAPGEAPTFGAYRSP